MEYLLKSIELQLSFMQRWPEGLETARSEVQGRSRIYKATARSIGAFLRAVAQNPKKVKSLEAILSGEVLRKGVDPSRRGQFAHTGTIPLVREFHANPSGAGGAVIYHPDPAAERALLARIQRHLTNLVETLDTV